MAKVQESGQIDQKESGKYSGEVFTLFKSILCKGVIRKVEREHGVTRYRNRVPIFTTLAVLWLMIFQRLNARHTQSAAIRELQAGKFSKLHDREWQKKCRSMSLSTSGYNQAGSLLPVTLVESLITIIIEGLLELLGNKLLWKGYRVFLLDGSGLSAAHETNLLESFPASTNNNNGGYWSNIRVVTAHELFSGVALVPTWGPMYGENAVSEQGLSKEQLRRLPKGSIVIGDANFGTFAMAWHATQNGLHPIVRLTPVRAKKVLLDSSIFKSKGNVTWKLSGHDRRANPEIEKTASISGRVISLRVHNPKEGKNEFVTIHLFTTLKHSEENILELYLKRWNIELDLKYIKRSANMAKLKSKSSDMAKKEILTGFAAYSLIRATMALAAIAHGKDPRSLSFSHALDVFHAHLPLIQLAKNINQLKVAVEDMLYAIAFSPIQRTKYKRKNQLRILRPRFNKFPTSMRPRPKNQYINEGYT